MLRLQKNRMSKRMQLRLSLGAIMAYRTVTQNNCPHDAKVKMPGFTDRYECTRCQKILQIIQ